MKGIYCYYVTYLDQSAYINFAPYGSRTRLIGLDIRTLIQGINISFSSTGIYVRHRIMENEDGTVDIDASLIKSEVCEALWERKYEYSYKKQGYSDDKLQEKKLETMKILEKNIVIIAWSETNV